MNIFSLLTSIISVWSAGIETPVFIPLGTFTPAGQVSFEVRDYAASVAAETCPQNSDDAFNILAEYIGVMTTPANDRTETIAMTAPVVTYQQQNNQCMQFILPESVYGSDVTSAPAPTNDDVTIVGRPQMIAAVMTFNGRASDEDFAARLIQLQLAVEQQMTTEDSTFQWVIKDPQYTESYQYNDPWTPGPWRTNEVVVQLVKKD